MKVSKVIEIFLDYHRNHSKPNTVRSYEAILKKFGLIFGDEDLEKISSEDILTFLSKITDGRKRQTRRTRYSHLAANPELFWLETGNVSYSGVKSEDNGSL
jgi:site-specific recombinase XerD